MTMRATTNGTLSLMKMVIPFRRHFLDLHFIFQLVFVKMDESVLVDTTKRLKIKININIFFIVTCAKKLSERESG